MNTDIYYYWDGYICDNRLDLLKTCIFSAKHFNPDRNVILYSNTITSDMLGNKYDIEIRTFDLSFFENTPLDISVITNYYGYMDNGVFVYKCPQRVFSDIFRGVLLYKYGGSYIDTDDICFRKLPITKNIVCRCYDPHTYHYSKISYDQLIPSKYREIDGYNLPMFIRSDCWLNWEKESDFMKDLLSNSDLNRTEKALDISDEFSYQALCLQICNKHLHNIGSAFNLRLSLLYLYESHLSGCSTYDYGHHGGEMHDLWNNLPDVNNYKRGEYKCTKNTAIEFIDNITSVYPDTCCLYLQDHNNIESYFSKEYIEYDLMTSQIYKHIKSLL
jgi:hypothetical protein